MTHYKESILFLVIGDGDQEETQRHEIIIKKMN